MWIIKNNHSKDWIMGSMIMPGNLGDHISFRSKAARQYGLLVTLWYLLKECLADGMITVACNSKSVLDQLQKQKQINPFAAHADLLRMCQNIIKTLSCKIRFKHVKGHQDSGHPTVLSSEAWLNIKANLSAKSHINLTLPDMAPCQKLYPTFIYSIYKVSCKNFKISCNLQ